MKICQEEETLYNTIAINATTNKSLPIIKFNAINDAFEVGGKKRAPPSPTITMAATRITWT